MHTSQKPFTYVWKKIPQATYRPRVLLLNSPKTPPARTHLSFLYSVIRSSIPRPELTGEATVGEASKRSDWGFGELCWAWQCFTMLCLRQTVQYCALRPLGYHRCYRTASTVALQRRLWLFVFVYVCICVCGTNVGQAVINLGLAMRSQTVNSRFSFQFLYTVEDKACPFFFWVWSRKQASTTCMFDVWLHSNKGKKGFCYSTLKCIVF